MDVIYPRCAGLDVHKDTVVACARVVEDGIVKSEVRTFGTTTRDLLALSDWLREQGCTHAAMESTGVYYFASDLRESQWLFEPQSAEAPAGRLRGKNGEGDRTGARSRHRERASEMGSPTATEGEPHTRKPVWHILEESIELVLANAMHIKNVPGRKTDVTDATWIADLLAHGLIRASFVPPTPVQEMRDLSRTRKQLVRETTQHTQRIQKTLEDANIKLSSVVSDVLGVSGRAILDALVDGETDPEKLASLASIRIKASRRELVEALRGNVRPHHRFLLRLHLGQTDALDQAVREVEARLGEALKPFRDCEALLITIPGVSQTTAHVILSEIGTDMARFPTSGHLISWAGLCPGNNESAGKRRSTRLRKGGLWLKATLVQDAWAAARKKGSYFKAHFHRIQVRRGPKKAAIAVAASMLTAAYHMLKNGTEYNDLTDTHFAKRDRARLAKRLVKRLTELGLEVKGSPMMA